MSKSLRSFRFLRKSPASKLVMSTAKLALAPSAAIVSGSASTVPEILSQTVTVSWMLDRARTSSLLCALTAYVAMAPSLGARPRCTARAAS
jgi:hypothetical protein